MSGPQRLVAIVVCFAIGLLACGFVLYSRSTFNDPVDVSLNFESDSQFIDIDVASKEATPEEVVKRQLKSLHDALTDPEQLKICYSLLRPKTAS